MSLVRTVTLKRNNETMAVDIHRSDEIMRYAAWPTISTARYAWFGNSFLELSYQWEKEGWVAVVGPDQQEPLNVAESVAILDLMRDMALLQSRVKILERQGFKRLDRKTRELDEREAKLNEREYQDSAQRDFGAAEIESQPGPNLLKESKDREIKEHAQKKVDLKLKDYIKDKSPQYSDYQCPKHGIECGFRYRVYDGKKGGFCMVSDKFYPEEELIKIR